MRRNPYPYLSYLLVTGFHRMDLVQVWRFIWGPIYSRFLKLIKEVGDMGNKLKNIRVSTSSLPMPGKGISGEMAFHCARAHKNRNESIHTRFRIPHRSQLRTSKC